MDLKEVKTLEELWQYTHNLNKNYFPNTDLHPIMGGGKHFTPKVMFVFINPTFKNVSSNANWQGLRRPFTGTKQIWRVFNKADLFSAALLREIEQTKDWTVRFANKVYGHLEEKGLYFTNIVKWTGHNSDLPDKQKIKLFLPVLQKEIEVVKPANIVAFGLIPFEGITNVKIRLNDYYEQVMSQNALNHYFAFDGKTKVYPCYFPIGRGNPKRAVEILKMLGLRDL